MSSPQDSLATLTAADFNALGRGWLPDLIGIKIVEVADRRVVARLEIRPHHNAPNGYLHAATVVALADTSCGYGCIANLPEGASGFTTVELKSNFLATQTDGAIQCVAEMAHGGRTTQLWDAQVASEGDGRLLALFRCTQLLLRPR